MTITDAPPADAAPAPPDPTGPDPVASGTAQPVAVDGRAGGGAWQTGLEALLVAGLAAVSGLAFTRILPAGQLTGRVVVAAAVATLVDQLARRVRAHRLLVSVGASLVAYAVVAGILLFRPDTLAGFPTPSSLHAIVDALVNGASRILTSAVPTPPVPSALIVPVTVAWLVAWAGSELAGRTRSPLLPALPAVVGYAFGLAFGGDAPLAGLTAGLVGLAGLLGVIRALPAGASPASRLRRLVTLGVPLVAGLALVAALVASTLGATSGQEDLHDRHRATQTFAPAITPLSQIQGQLLTQPAVELFHVTVAPGVVDLLPNWRLTVLDHFDGSQWSSPETYVPAGGVLPPSAGTVATTTDVTERITVDHLGGVWLPTAGVASRTSLALVDVGTTSGSLALADGVRPGLTYQVQATVAQFPAATMAGATPAGGGDDIALPDSAPADLAVIRQYAQVATRRGADPAAKLVLLQNYLRTDHFTATPQSAAGQSYARVADFLRKHRVGTSEQFATAFVLMARTLGYPARVAVGFRRGASTDGRFTVTSADAYAWPEVRFADLGWVPFDPTPEPSGAAAPGAAAAPVTTPGGSGGAATQLVPQANGTAPETTTTSRAGDSSLVPLVVGALVLLVVVALVAVPLVVVGLGRRRTRRRREAPDPAERVVGAWHEAMDQVRRAEVSVSPSLTASEVVSTAGLHLGPEVAGSLGTLRTLANQAMFAAEPPSADQAERAWVETDRVTATVVARLGPWRRLLTAVDPRGRPGARVRRAATG